jgi:hypothetical protein
MTRTKCAAMACGAALALSLGGCTYDYLQNTDRVGYHAGDAVNANLVGETVNPTKSSMYNRTQLGKDGNVIPPETTASP